MDYKFFTKDKEFTYLEMGSSTYQQESQQLIEQGFIEQSLIVSADSPEKAQAMFKDEHQGFFKKLNMLLGPFITSGYHRS
ncbi:hypothetical protein H2O73_12070 [Vibrio sp. 404]|uniref:Uncharacterized protein n=1 Tax=Vibrio marinisediminis TaxID=2758441 RepID=A0A7W2IUC6_9VIBR|nr:hypothetical protein [Vibrio marinisediminis]MBA5763088.1 hypothetical protein [Vibrio marinisediminis]